MGFLDLDELCVFLPLELLYLDLKRYFHRLKLSLKIFILPLKFHGGKGEL